MGRAATSRLKVNPPLGRMPVLQYLQPDELEVDAQYQRSVEAADSQALIRKIAQRWNWDLCLPLVVSRRFDGEAGRERLFVIDGQHRLEAARLRKDIGQLPCQVVSYDCAADEAASFVHLNQQRRPLSKLDLFKAAVASEDPEACAILTAMEAAGLTLAPHMSSVAWKPGMLGNIGGIEQAWRQHNAVAAGEALQCLATAFAGEVLRYAGTLYPGIVAVCTKECRDRQEFEPARFARFTAMLGERGQARLREDVMLEVAASSDLGRVASAVRVITEMWWPERRKTREAVERAQGKGAMATLRQAQGERVEGEGAFRRMPKDDASDPKTAWCAQCDRRVSFEAAGLCQSRFCSLRKAG